MRRADSSEDLGVVGALESLTLSRVAAQVIVLFDDQMIRKSDDFTIQMILLSDDDQMIVITNDHNSARLFEEENFVAFLKDDIAVEMIVLYCTIIR